MATATSVSASPAASPRASTAAQPGSPSSVHSTPVLRSVAASSPVQADAGNSRGGASSLRPVSARSEAARAPPPGPIDAGSPMSVKARYAHSSALSPSDVVASETKRGAEFVAPVPYRDSDVPEGAAYAHRGARSARVRYKFPVKQACLAACLLVLGVAMIVVGCVEGSLAVLFVGVLAILPGGYQSWILYNTWKRKPGYRIEETYEMVDL